jgi:peptidoglycan/xylan/chitin deacetylase (PgdA/CDA1 family)
MDPPAGFTTRDIREKAEVGVAEKSTSAAHSWSLEPSARAMQRAFLRVAGLSGLARLISHAMGQCGAILMFHEVRAAQSAGLSNATAARLLDYALRWLRRSNWQIVTLEEGLARVRAGTPSGRFAVLTFDDGYRDLVTCALPILERHGAPFTVYIPTGAVTRDLFCWWLGLRELVERSDTVVIDVMNRRFDCSTLRAKRCALEHVGTWVGADYRRAELLRPMLASSGMSFAQLNERYFLDQLQVAQLARHPLATIGGHATSHRALAILEIEEARREMRANREYLESVTQRPVRHFANPYGGRTACGDREAVLAAEVGFSSAVTTRHGHLACVQESNPFMLPRIAIDGTDTPTTFNAKISGAKTAVLRALGRD